MTPGSIKVLLATTLMAACILLAGCSAEAPQPTANVAPEIRITANVMQTSAPPTIREIVDLPTVAVNALPTIDGESSFAASATIAAAATDKPTATRSFIGSIINKDYTLPPTSTSRPSVVPSATPVTLPPTSVRTTVTTPLPIDRIRLDGSQMGIQVHYNFDVAGWDRTLKQIAALRMGWVKLQAAWKWLQPDYAGQFEQNFRLFQLHVQEAKKRGNKVMLSIAKAPDWARNVDRTDDGPPDDLNEVRTFIEILLQKVGPYIDAIELWNEPNLKREWTGAHAFNGAGYMELFRVGYKAVRAYSPTIAVITAGLAPTGNASNVSVNDRSFLRQMYQAGLASYSDVVIGIHPYSWGNPPDFVCCDNTEGQGWDDRPQFFFLQNINDYADIIRANGGSAQMWATEFGWATWEHYPSEPPDPWMTYNTAHDQLDYTLRAFQIGQSRPDIGVMILWNLSFAEELTISRRSELAGYSLLYPVFDGSENRHQRPLYQALAARP